MSRNKPMLGPAIDRQDDGKPVRPVVDPRKIGTRLSQRLLPQVPSAPIKLRKTARPK